jgi:hypothetical protein
MKLGAPFIALGIVILIFVVVQAVGGVASSFASAAQSKAISDQANAISTQAWTNLLTQCLNNLLLIFVAVAMCGAGIGIGMWWSSRQQNQQQATMTLLMGIMQGRLPGRYQHRLPAMYGGQQSPLQLTREEMGLIQARRQGGIQQPAAMLAEDYSQEGLGDSFEDLEGEGGFLDSWPM